jgi:hypothetical protein
MILNHHLSLSPTDWDLYLDVVPIFLDAMMPLDMGLTPHNEISRNTSSVGIDAAIWLLRFLLFRVILSDTCSVGTNAAFIEKFFWMIHVFLMYLWDAGLILLFFFRNFSHLHGFLCLAACLKKIFTLFIWQSLYTFYAMCWVQKRWTASPADSCRLKSDL